MREINMDKIVFKKTSFEPSRRNFLKTSLSVSVASAIAPWAINLAAIGEARADRDRRLFGDADVDQPVREALPELSEL